MLFNSVFLIVGIFAAQALAAPYAELAERTTCTAANAAVRKEWSVSPPVGFRKSFADVCRGSFTPAERKCYTDAVVCLQNLPSQLNSTEVPGAKSRYDGILFSGVLGCPIDEGNRLFGCAYQPDASHSYERLLPPCK